MSLNKVPYEHFGPFKEEITLPKAMQFIATTMILEGEL